MSEKEVIYYRKSIEANSKKLQHVHDIMSLALGVAAGVLSLESLYGFMFYGVGLTITNVVFYVVCCHNQPKSYFRDPVQEIFVSSLSNNVAGFVMAWCLVYALVK